MNGGSRSHGGDRTIIMQLFLTVLPFSFVTQDVKIVMVGYLGLVQYTYLHWTRRIWKHLSHTFCWWRYGLFSLLKFADLFCNGDGTISLPLMLKEKLSCAQCTNCKVWSWKSEADAYFACLVTGASIARAITKSTTGLGFQLVVNLKCSQKY